MFVSLCPSSVPATAAIQPHALLRNLADVAVETLLEDQWWWVGGWGGAKKYLVGVDEEVRLPLFGPLRMRALCRWQIEPQCRTT